MKTKQADVPVVHKSSKVVSKPVPVNKEVVRETKKNCSSPLINPTPTPAPPKPKAVYKGGTNNGLAAMAQIVITMRETRVLQEEWRPGKP